MFRDSAKGLIAAIANGDVKAIALQDLLQAEKDVRVVFDDQNSGAHLISHSGFGF
jgi:hypothetical protein